MIVRKDKPGLDATKMPTSLDVAWAAGIYEGEGSCTACGHGKNSFLVSVTQKDPELLYKICDLFGGRIKLYNVGHQKRVPIYYWQLCGDRGRSFLGLIYPFLTARRKAQIDVTSVRAFLDFAGSLLLLNPQEDQVERYVALCVRVKEFTRMHREANSAKRVKYLDSYYDRKSQNPAWMEQRRKNTARWRHSRKEQHQAEIQNIVSIA